MAQTIITKHSEVAGRVPASLQKGELAVNITDQKMYVGSGSATVELGGSGGGEANPLLMEKVFYGTASDQTVYGLSKQGKVYAWGRNPTGAMGQGVGAPAPIGFLLVPLPYHNKVVVDVIPSKACTYYIMRVKAYKDVFEIYHAGDSGLGQFGYGTTDNLYPKRLATSVTRWWAPTYCSYTSDSMFYYERLGKIYGCGKNAQGRMGDNTTTPTTGKSVRAITYPTGVSKSNVKMIYSLGANQGCTFLSTTDNKLFVCGYNTSGQLGIGNTTNQKKFVEVTAMRGKVIKQIVGGYAYHNGKRASGVGGTIILLENGEVWSAGSGQSNYNGFATTKKTFLRLPMTNVINLGTTGVEGFTIAEREDGSLYIWGTDPRACMSLHVAKTSNSTGTIYPAKYLQGALQSRPNISFDMCGYYRAYNRTPIFWNANGDYRIATRNEFGDGGDGTFTKIEFSKSPVLHVPIEDDDMLVQMFQQDQYGSPVTLALTRKGVLYGCGRGTWNQLPCISRGCQINANISVWQRLN